MADIRDDEQIQVKLIQRQQKNINAPIKTVEVIESKHAIVRYLLQRCLHESDLWPKALYNLGNGSRLAWASNNIAAHYAAI